MQLRKYHQRVGTALRAMAFKNLGEVTLISTRPLHTCIFFTEHVVNVFSSLYGAFPLRCKRRHRQIVGMVS